MSTNTVPVPANEMMKPASAGPMARATLMPRLFSAMAACNCALGTISGVIAAQAGIIIAVPMPMAKVRTSSVQAVVMPVRVSAAGSCSFFRSGLPSVISLGW